MRHFHAFLLSNSLKSFHVGLDTCCTAGGGLRFFGGSSLGFGSDGVITSSFPCFGVITSLFCELLGRCCPSPEKNCC